MTLEAWIKTTETTGTHAIASYYLENTTNRGGILQMVSGKMQFVGRIGTTTTYTSGSGTTNVADGKWHHVVGTVDNGVWKVYVDGQLESTSSTSVAGNFTGLVQKMNVGRVNTTGTTYTSWAKACIKEVSMWNYTKAAAEIETNFEDYVGYTGSETGLKGYWKVREGSGTNYDDVTSQSNDLTTTGSPSWSNDAMVDYYTADVQSYSDYFPFGMKLSGRSGSASDYRYGVSGMEGDPEIKGEGNSYDFGARMYDPRIGRWYTADKLQLMAPGWSPYRAFFDNPNFWTDPDGNIEWPLKGTQVANKKDLPGGVGDENTIVRTSTYQEIRDVGTSPHIGIDYRASIGTPVYSLGDGVVSDMYTSKSGIIILEVTYGNGDKLRFLHLSEYADGLAVGSTVKEGQIIAYSGNSGGYPAHLHVDAVDKNGKSIDPEATNYGEMTNAEFFGEGGQESSSIVADEALSCAPTACVSCPTGIDATTTQREDAQAQNQAQTQTTSNNQTTYNVTASNLNLRFGAGIVYESNGDLLPKGSTLTGTGNVDGSWTQVATSDGRIGWVNSSYVSKNN